MGYLDKHIPTLEGEDAERFLKLAEENEKHSGSVDFSEQMKAFEKIMQNSHWGGTNNKFEEYLEDCHKAAENINEIRKEEKKKVVDKVVEYLDSELYTTCDYFGKVQTASRDSINKKEFIEKLCKAMEE